jgi:hypothetical protein
MFIIFSCLFVKRIGRESNDNGKEDMTNNVLVRAKSQIMEIYGDLLCLLFNNFEERLEKIGLLVFKGDFNIPTDNDLETMNNNNYTCNDIFNIKNNKNKLHFILMTFYIIIIPQDEKVQFVFKNYILWSKLLILSPFANEKNLK